jgi:hypothetical protein
MNRFNNLSHAEGIDISGGAVSEPVFVTRP